MNWNQVLAGLKQGKKYRRQSWVDGSILCLFSGFMCNNSYDKRAFVFVAEDFEATDWEEVIE